MKIILVMLLVLLSLPILCYADQEYYIVQKGDTLGEIAEQFLGKADKWKQIWEMNPEIVDPNFILAGQKIRIVAKPKILKPAELKEKLVQLMFKVRNIPYTDSIETIIEVSRIATQIADWQASYRVRESLGKYEQALIKLELHQLADAIAYSSSQEMAILLTALAWQETHFLNRKGGKGEVSAFQIMPTTFYEIVGGVDEKALKKLEENSYIATEFVIKFFSGISIDQGLKNYNINPDYIPSIKRKMGVIRRELMKE